MLLELARFHQARGAYEDARRLYVDVLETDSTVAEAHLGLAKVAEATEDAETVQTHLKRYLDLQPAGRQAEWARSKLED